MVLAVPDAKEVEADHSPVGRMLSKRRGLKTFSFRIQPAQDTS
jgi:hypothetical protein